MGYDEEDKSIWQHRAVRAGLINFRGKLTHEMNDAEIQVAFDYLSRQCGISYIWL